MAGAAGRVRRNIMTLSDIRPSTRRVSILRIPRIVGAARSRRPITGASDRSEVTALLTKERVMNTQANVAVNAARKAVYDKVESQMHTFEAQLVTLKARAESAKADAELKAIANLLTAKGTLDHKVAELKQAGEAAFQQAKADVETRIAEFGKSVKAIESKIKVA
jgi:hypothetical protein